MQRKTEAGAVENITSMRGIDAGGIECGVGKVSKRVTRVRIKEVVLVSKLPPSPPPFPPSLSLSGVVM